jgi:phospholipid-translocating ATPase
MHTGASGQKFNPEFGTQMFNLVWSSLPILTLAVIDKDQGDVFSARYPQLYGPGIKAQFFNTNLIMKWLIEAMYESACITMITLHSLPSVSPHGTDPGAYRFLHRRL